jgi:hypothetical protein
MVILGGWVFLMSEVPLAGYIEGGEYIYCSSMEMADHQTSFSAQVLPS